MTRNGIANLPTRGATLPAGKCATKSLRLWKRKIAGISPPRNEIFLPCILSGSFRLSLRIGRNGIQEVRGVRFLKWCAYPREGGEFFLYVCWVCVHARSAPSHSAPSPP